MLRGRGASEAQRQRLTHAQLQNRITAAGLALMATGLVIQSTWLTKLAGKDRTGKSAQILFGPLASTVGAMLIAVSDVDLDHFARRHRRAVLGFAVVFAFVYAGIGALTPPITAAHQLIWLATLPFIYFLLRSDSVLQMQSTEPRFSTLFAASLCLDHFSLHNQILVILTHSLRGSSTLRLPCTS